MAGLDNLDYTTATSRDLYIAILQDLDSEGSEWFDGLDGRAIQSFLGLIGQLAQASAVEQLAEALNRFVDIHEINSVGKVRER